MKALLVKCSICLLTSSLALTACKKSENIEKHGVIIDHYLLWSTINGPGSIYDIRFTNDTAMYQIVNDLTQFGITTTTNFPVNVIVTTKPDNRGYRLITITALKVSN